MKQFSSIFILLMFVWSAFAQTEVKYNPDLQTVDDGFFDPTREEKKPREPYEFKMEYRLQGGYLQSDQRMPADTARYGFLHGGEVGVTFTFLLPLHFSMQTGLLYSCSYGSRFSRYRSVDAESVQQEYIRHRTFQHQFAIPVRAYYTVPLWRKLNMFFYTGPQLQIGLAQRDNMRTHLSLGTREWLQAQGTHVEPYDRYTADELYRINVQYGLGGGFEWDCYRLQAGYDFGLNNLLKKRVASSDRMWEWQWAVSFCYRL